MNTNGDVILSQNFTAMLEQARNDLQQVQLALQKSTDFNDILDILNRGELCRQYARQQRYGIEIQNSGAEIKIRAATNDRYQTMTVDQIAALPVDQLAADDSRLHLWVPNSFLFEAKDIMDSWGFNYKSVFVWCKPSPGLGNYWRVATEFFAAWHLWQLSVSGSEPVELD